MQTPADLGWGDPKGLDFSGMTRYQVWPGHWVLLRSADVATVMTELIRRLRAAGWHGPDSQLDEWGYNRRLKRWAESAGQQLLTAPLSSWSDHAWGTAMDLDTAANPMYAQRPSNPQAHTTLPVAACPGVASALGLEWGGSWAQPWDPQHWQVAVSPARLHAIAEQLRSFGPDASTPTAEEDEVSYDDAVRAIRDVLHLPATGLATPVGQPDNGGLARILVSLAQGQVNRDRALAGAVARLDDPAAVAAAIVAKLLPQLPAGSGVTADQVHDLTVAAVREVFADASKAG